MKAGIRRLFYLILALSAGVLLFRAASGSREAALLQYYLLDPLLHASDNTLRLGAEAAEKVPYSVALNPLLELDFKTRDEIFRLRQFFVSRHPGLTGPYAPAHSVFGGMGDGRPWWGIEGVYFYGPGTKSIAGLSRQSAALANPFLLIALVEPNAWKSGSPPQSEWDHFPQPLKLRYFPPEKIIEVVYSVKSYVNYAKERQVRFMVPGNMKLSALNARDFGYSWYYPVSLQSVEIDYRDEAEKAVRITQMIEVGFSCGYPGGCNGVASIEDRDPYLTVHTIPARLEVRLWKGRPENVDSPADARVLISME